MTGWLLLSLAAALAAGLGTGAPALALEPDEVVLVVNGRVPASVTLAEFYAKARLIPEGRVCKLDVTAAEEMPFNEYESDVVPAVRTFLRDNRLEGRVKCLVTFFGVPIRVAGKQSTPAEKQELADLRQQLGEAANGVERAVVELETLAAEAAPQFERGEGKSSDDLARRADAAVRAAASGAMRLGDEDRRRDVLARVVATVTDLAGASSAAELRGLLKAADVPATRPAIAPVPRAQVERRMLEFQDKRYDADARRELRVLAAEQLGLLGSARMLAAQVEYLDNDGTAAAFDSELALVWWRFYSRSRWQPNPLYHKARAAGVTAPPVMMVTRLDGPQDGTARDVVLASLRAERDGLSGRFVIDSRGIPARDGNGKANGYGAYDQTLRDLSHLLTTRTKLPVTFDNRDAVLPAGSLRDVALYCGWYSVRNYVPAMTFKPGAVGFHVASFEMVSLRNEDEKGWVRGLLNDGVSATMGSVAEPYLTAFPAADEFFPLLLTGELTLAEVYWATTPMTSWMMSIIGDPLYKPFAKDPQLEINQLPENLREYFLHAATRPAQ